MVSEGQRLAELAAYTVVNTTPDPAFDDIVRVVAEAAGCPTALVSLLDEDRQWFLARCGLDVSETPRDQAFCEHALRADAPLVVPDATLDPRFDRNPLVTGPPGIRFYAGFPLRTPTGAVLGTLCVLDYAPRPAGLTAAQERLLAVLAAQVMAQLELRRSLAVQAETMSGLETALASYRALAEHATDVVSRHLLDGTTLYVSPSIEQVLGYDPAAEVGCAAPERIHPDDVQVMFSCLSEVMGGRSSTANVRSRHADGSWLHLEIRLSPVRDDTGTVVQVHSAARDVTERHQAQELLRLSEERFRVLFDANPVGQVALTAQGLVERVNTAFADLIGVSAGDLIGAPPPWTPAAPHSDADPGHRWVGALDQPGTVVRSEQVLTRSDGTSVEVAETVVGVPGPDGRTEVVIASVVDVTERNRTQRLLAQMAEELRIAHDEAVSRTALIEAVLQTVDVGIVACDAEGHLTIFNRVTRELHGMPADAALDPADWADRYDLFAEDGATPLTRDQVPLFLALTKGHVTDTAIVIAAQGQPARTLQCQGRTMTDELGQSLGAVVAMTDVTQARATARALAEQAQYTRILLENAHAAIWSFAANGRPTFVNPAAQSILGLVDLETLQRRYDRGEVTGLANAVQLLRPDRTPLEASERPLARALAGQHTGEVELLVIAEGQPERTVLLAGSPLRDAEGDVNGAMLTGYDVTALRASEARFQAAFLNGPTPVARLDAQGVVLEINPALRRLTSLRDHLLVGHPFTDHVLPDDRPRLHRALTGTGTGAEPAEIRLVRLDAQPVWCELATTVSTDPDGTRWILAQLLDVDARKRQETVLEEAVGRDSLTGVANRTHLRALTERALLDGPAGAVTGMLFLDLDGFKTVNDSHGHEAGDAVLVEVARRLTATVRPSDTVIRLGGDEFLIVCPLTSTQPDQVLTALAERLKTATAVPITVKGCDLVVGVSVGTAVGHPGQSLDDLVEAADQAMYRQKRRPSR